MADRTPFQEIDKPATPEDQILRLAAEEISIAKEVVETGRIRVSTVTREHQQLIDEALERVGYDINHVPVGRTVDSIPAIRHEGDVTIVPVVEEVLVLQRRLVLKEEVHITRVRTTEQHRESVTLRRQEAVVTRLPPEAPGAQPDPEPRLDSTLTNKD